MVGNSLQSDILPVLHIGGRAVHVPYRTTWALDRAAPAAVEAAQFDTIADLSQLERYIDALSASDEGPHLRLGCYGRMTGHPLDSSTACHFRTTPVVLSRYVREAMDAGPHRWPVLNKDTPGNDDRSREAVQ